MTVHSTRYSELEPGALFVTAVNGANCHFVKDAEGMARCVRYSGSGLIDMKDGVHSFSFVPDPSHDRSFAPETYVIAIPT